MPQPNIRTWYLLASVGMLCTVPSLVVSQSSAALRSCHGVDFDPDDGIPYIIFSAHSYPAVSAKMEQDFDVDRIADLAALGSFTGFAITDMFVPTLTFPCSYEAYDANECRPNFLFGALAPVEDATLTGERLSYRLVDEEAGVINDIVIGNRSYDSLTLTSTKAGATTISAWNRSADGTETYSGDSGDGNVTRYTERPDCSGEGYVAEAENGSVKRTAELRWTSPKADAFTLTYTLCNYVDGTDCVSGAF